MNAVISSASIGDRTIPVFAWGFGSRVFVAANYAAILYASSPEQADRQANELGIACVYESTLARLASEGVTFA